jgi:hypothetical protein
MCAARSGRLASFHAGWLLRFGASGRRSTARYDPSLVARRDEDTRGELAGIFVVLIVMGIIGALIFGLWLGTWAALIVTAGFALATIAVMFVLLSRRERPPAGDAPLVQPLHDGRFRILVVADGWDTTPGFVEELRSHAGGRQTSFFVMAPAVGTRLGMLGDDQKDYEDAAGRLKDALAGLEAAGLGAQGQIGSSDPLQAADDGLRQFPADEIVFVTHPDARTDWVEQGLIEQAKSRYGQPVEHVVV